MDQLVRIKAHHDIERCQSMDELKSICRALLEMHFASKSMIGTMILEGLPTAPATYSQDSGS